MKISHYDLKLDNMLINFKKEKVKNNIFEWIFFKINIFSTSNIIFGKTPKNKNSNFIYGTLKICSS